MNYVNGASDQILLLPHLIAANARLKTTQRICDKHSYLLRWTIWVYLRDNRIMLHVNNKGAD